MRHFEGFSYTVGSSKSVPCYALHGHWLSCSAPRGFFGAKELWHGQNPFGWILSYPRKSDVARFWLLLRRKRASCYSALYRVSHLNFGAKLHFFQYQNIRAINVGSNIIFGTHCRIPTKVGAFFPAKKSLKMKARNHCTSGTRVCQLCLCFFENFFPKLIKVQIKIMTSVHLFSFVFEEMTLKLLWDNFNEAHAKVHQTLKWFRKSLVIFKAKINRC